MSSYILGKLAFDERQLQEDLQVFETFPRIAEAYDEYSSGFWMNCSLWNASGDKYDTVYRDFSHPLRQTDYARSLPYINQVLQQHFVFEHLKMIRSRNLIDAIVLPHRDFVEIDRTRQCIRVFVPLEDNMLAFHSDEQAVFCMRKGEIWFFDAAVVHAAANFSNKSRLCLCLDYIFPEEFHPADIFVDKNEYTPGLTPTLVPREQPDTAFLASLITGLGSIINRYNFKEIIFLLSKIHFYQQIPITACFDWLVQIADQSTDHALCEKAQQLRSYLTADRVFGQRFSLSEW